LNGREKGVHEGRRNGEEEEGGKPFLKGDGKRELDAALTPHGPIRVSMSSFSSRGQDAGQSARVLQLISDPPSTFRRLLDIEYTTTYR
jgi:hypothetical protein